MPTTQTPNKNLTQQAQSTQPWDAALNNDLGILDLALAGSQVINLTGAPSAVLLNSTYPISGNCYLPLRLYLTGTLSQATTIQIPAGVSGFWIVHNAVTMSGGPWPIYMANVGAGATVQCLLGVQTPVFCDGTNAILIGSRGHVAGDLRITATPYASPSADPPGWLICDGRNFSVATYPALYAAIGTVYGGSVGTNFNIPDYRGRVLMAADDQGTRGAANVMTGWPTGHIGGAAVHTLTIAEMPAHSHTDGAGHNHPDPGHSHGVSPGAVFSNVGGGQSPYGVNNNCGMQTITIATASSNLQVAHVALDNTGSGTPHSIVQPSLGASILIATGF